MNPESEPKIVQVRLIMDRDKNPPYDYDVTSGRVNVPASSTHSFEFLFVTSKAGTYYRYGVGYALYNEIKVTDQWSWGDPLKVEVKPLSVSVKTDKSIYEAGDTLLVSGRVSPLKQGNHISIQVLDPNNTIAVTQVSPDSYGKYIASVLKFSESMKEGKYSVIARYLGASAKTTFSFFHKLVGTMVFGKPELIELTDTNFEPITPKENDPFFVHVKYTNMASASKEVIVYTQIKDAKEVVVYLGALKTSIAPKASAEAFLGPATGLLAGNYKAETFIWDADTLSPLGEKGEILFTITKS
ncbi:MAG: hypothetical protein QXX95_05790 [Nitrososphaerales archaeon]